MQEAQSLGLTTSATNVFGFGKRFASELNICSRIRDHQDYAIAHYGKGFTSFIAWPVQLESNTFGKEIEGKISMFSGRSYRIHSSFSNISFILR